MESRSLVEISSSRIPEVLGNFHLDDHNVEEWSDAGIPGVRHNARQESGKWINPDSNADIKYQKREDCKQSDRSKEQTRTEVIQGQAPDSTFQIVRSHTQFQDVDDTSNSRVQTSSTSYQMSSSRGVRSTSKSSSNRTTTKTVTVSGGRSDNDFENLGMSFQPLDTSTQRERINVSRSGTMGVRRPPTRRHTPAATQSSSPEDDNIDTRDEIIVDSDDNMRNTPDLRRNVSGNSGGVSIIGFKNISPKIRVGFPVEIQLELQTKLRASSNLGRGCEDDDTSTTFEKTISIGKNKESGSTYHHPSTISLQDTHRVVEIEQIKRSADDSATTTPLFELSANNEDSTFDFKHRRKSYGFDSFDSHAKQTSERIITDNNIADVEISQCDIYSSKSQKNPVAFHHSISKSNYMGDSFIDRNKTSSSDKTDVDSNRSAASHASRLSPTSISRSWDLIQSAHTAQQRREENKKIFQTCSTTSGSQQSTYNAPITEKTFSKRTVSKLNPTTQKTIITLNADEESRFQESRNDLDTYPMDSLDSTLEISNLTSQHHHLQQQQRVAKQEETEIPGYIPDVLDHETSTLSPSLERSRKLLKMLDETPDLLHKMSYKNYFSDGFKLEERHWADDKGGADWETQRQLSFLNDSLTRILEDGRNKENIFYDKTGKNNSIINNNETIQMPSTDEILDDGGHNDLLLDEQVDCNGNVKSRVGQISQTWISSGDPSKPSQKVRDNDVTTSISATNDPFKRGPKKVEFCKTEVHFTADSGKFHIVETDENKPSTSHLFRKKKKGDKGKQSVSLSLPPLQDNKLLVKSTAVPVEGESVQKSQSDASCMFQLNSSNSNSSREESEGRELKNGVGAIESLLFQQNDKEGKSEQNESTISRGAPPTTSITSAPNSHSTVKQILTSSDTISYTKGNRDSSNPSNNTSSNIKKSLPLLSFRRETLNDDSDEAFARKSQVLMNVNNNIGGGGVGIRGDDDDETHSPSHMILANYGEMKIQRYLKQLTSPSSQNGSESPTESVLHEDQDHSSNHFRFDNVLYENGSFVPLATRRSLIEMNNRNRKRNNNINSHTSGNSSTMSNYSLPNSDKDNSTSSSNYQPLRLARMEAKVATARANPQITSVELRYELDNERPYNPEPIMNRQSHLSMRQHLQEQEKRNYVPSPVMPSDMKSSHSHRKDKSRFLYSDSPDEDETEVADNHKPPTPILPVSYTTFEKGDVHRDRSYYKNPACGCDSNQVEQNSYKNRSNELLMSTSSITSKSHNKGSKSIVMIGDYDVCQTSAMSDYNDKSEPLSPEPVLSMDHTWKGPAHFDHENNATKGLPIIRSLTFPKSSRTEPEWVSKARSRESRMTDWDLIGKQSVSVTPVKVEPPWMDEIIRFRSKSSTEEIKTLPKISVVYPWQRDSSMTTSKTPLEEYDKPLQVEEEETHILSIVPNPALLSSRKEKSQGNFVSKSSIVQSPKSLTELPALLQVSKRDIVDRDFDSILINPTQILKKAEESSTRHKLRSDSHIKSSSTTTGISDRSHGRTHASSNMGESLSMSGTSNMNHEDTSLISTTSRGRHSTKSSGERKEKDNSNNANKPPMIRPPPRVSSLNKQEANQSKSSKATTIQTSQTKEKATTATTKGIKTNTLKKSEVEESSGSSRSNTPIHRHPLVKVSKLPIRKNLAGKPTEVKPTKVKNKDKHNVGVNLDTKQSQSGNLGDAAKGDSSAKAKKSSERRNVEPKVVKTIPYSNKKK